MNNLNKKKLLVILGPTATGKTTLAVKLASQFNGEIVSADSRQVYKGMDIGTGKDLDDYVVKSKVKSQKSKVIRTPYHLIDVVSPKTEFNLAKYLKLAHRAIKDIQERGKLPILAGGTGLYLQAIVDGYNLSQVKPDKKLREKLEKKSVLALQKMLSKLDPKFSNDLKNKRYLIRYIEIAKQTKKPLQQFLTKQGSEYDCLVLGVKFSREVINQRIDKRLIQRINREKMIEEVERLHKEGVSWKRLESFGLEYKFIGQYLQKKLNKEELIEKLAIAIHQFAKRQMSWFGRWERQVGKIKWIKNYSVTKKLVKKWL